MRRSEDAFLCTYALPALQQCVAAHVESDKVKEAILSEYYRNMQDSCLETPARRERHPFTKMLGVRPKEIIAQWQGENGPSLKQACPDIALKESSRAECELVTSIYQAFFYRGLPYVPPKGKSPAWDYDFACLLACDASPQGNLRNVWANLKREVKRGFWEGANIYVMILRNDDGAKQQDSR
jgi:hypothetical protein